MSRKRETLRIGSGAGFAGDRLEPAVILAERGGLQYLGLECLAERTIALAQLRRLKEPAEGYDVLLARRMELLLPVIKKKRVRLITNMGAANPVAAADLIVEIAKRRKLDIKVAAVTGDDVLKLMRPTDRVLETGGPLSAYKWLVSANAYLGVDALLPALATGADIIITGRVADPSLFLAPAAYEYSWEPDDLDRMARGTVMGHLLECAGQITGGYFADPGFKDVPDIARLGFPIAEVAEDGTAVITKVPGTGGVVSAATCTEQLLYEVHDPARYLSPDVVADFTSLTLTDLGDDRVRVSGTRGLPAPPTYKGLVCTPAGWAGEATFAYPWPDAEAKARAAVRWVKQRAIAAKIPVEEWLEEYFGVNAFGGPTVDADAAPEPPEVIGRLAWRCADEKTAARVAQGSGVLGLSGPPTISGFGRARGGKPTQLLAVDAFAVDRALVDRQVRVDLVTV